MFLERQNIYLVCGVAVPDNEFAILGSTDQKPERENLIMLRIWTKKETQHEGVHVVKSHWAGTLDNTHLRSN